MREHLNKIFTFKNIFIAFLLLLILCVPFALTSFKSSPTAQISDINPDEQDELDRIISSSKYDLESAIETLKALSFQSAIVEYRRNYILASLYEKNEEYVKALEEYKNLLDKKYLLKERVILHYADLNIKIGDDKTALQFYNKLLKEFPYSKTVPQAKYKLAQALSRLRYTSQAISTFKSISEEFPYTDFGIASNYYLGEHSLNKKNYGDTLNYWRKYLDQSPGGTFALDITKSLISNKSFDLTQKDYSLIGSAFYEVQDYKNAANYLLASNDNEKYYDLGYSLFRTKQNDPAKDIFIKYAKTADPEALKTRFALYYASLCIPSSGRIKFWRSIRDEIPALEYYAIYKEAVTESNARKTVNLLQDLISRHPDSPFTLDAVWDLMWVDIASKNYKDALELGSKYYELSKLGTNKSSTTRIKVGFWLGKLSEYLSNPEQAKSFYKETGSLSFDDYYAHRARYKLQLLLSQQGSNDNHWKLKYTPYDLDDFRWSIPTFADIEVLKEYFGTVVAELINLQQFDEAIELIDKGQSPSPKIKAWLKALNKDYMDSINSATLITQEENLPKTDPLFKLAYPMYYWDYIIHHSKKYPSFDPLLACGIIRQESRYERKAVSVSEARGLMQLIPSTARMVANTLGINLSSLDLLFDPKINTALGVDYIQGVISQFNNPMFAVAGYNAGPGASNKWIRQFGTSDLDLFVEQIPYDETKGYVKSVFGSYWTYIELYGPAK